MSIPRRAAEFALAGSERQRLEEHLQAEEDRVRRALKTQAFREPVCAVAFVYTGQEDIPLASETYALTQRARDAAFARHGEQALWVLWSTVDWDHTDLVGWPTDQTVVERAKRVAVVLTGVGSENPERAVACELAYRLARSDWSDVMPVTEDFAFWASNDELTQETLDNFRACVTSEVAEAYEARRWLRFPDEFALRS
jgi:hypothetical protein